MFFRCRLRITNRDVAQSMQLFFTYTHSRSGRAGARHGVEIRISTRRIGRALGQCGIPHGDNIGKKFRQPDLYPAHMNYVLP